MAFVFQKKFLKEFSNKNVIIELVKNGLIVSPNMLNNYMNTVVVVPFTSN